MKNCFPGVICLSQPQACGQRAGSPCWGQGQVRGDQHCQRGTGRPRAALLRLEMRELSPAAPSLHGFGCCVISGALHRSSPSPSCSQVSKQALAPCVFTSCPNFNCQVFLNRNCLEKTSISKHFLPFRTRCSYLAQPQGHSCLFEGCPTQLLLLLRALC